MIHPIILLSLKISTCEIIDDKIPTRDFIINIVVVKMHEKKRGQTLQDAPTPTKCLDGSEFFEEVLICHRVLFNLLGLRWRLLRRNILFTDLVGSSS
jgi:hypothetical protein